MEFNPRYYLEQIDLQKQKEFLQECKKGRNYYLNKNDISNRNMKNEPYFSNHSSKNPLKTADNRISHNWHGLLVNQKTSYLFRYPPTITLENGENELKVKEVLGEKFSSILQKLCVEASNTGIAWLHYWRDENQNFQYGQVETEQIIPIYSKDLLNKLEAVVRHYQIYLDGNYFVKYEVWDREKVTYFLGAPNGSIAELQQVDEVYHKLGGVPFIPFLNNSEEKSDLIYYKDLIDQYDKVESGFANDLQDVQELIFVLQGYGGESLNQFMSDLKEHKVVNVDGDGDVRTIKAEIPFEARKEFLANLKEAIYTFGMGVKFENTNLGNASGVGLKFLYSLLSLKAGMTELHFTYGIKSLVKAILSFYQMGEENIKINYRYNMINNDLETVEICQNSKEIVNEDIILAHHPWVDNVKEDKK